MGSSGVAPTRRNMDCSVGSSNNGVFPSAWYSRAKLNASITIPVTAAAAPTINQCRHLRQSRVYTACGSATKSRGSSNPYTCQSNNNAAGVFAHNWPTRPPVQIHRHPVESEQHGEQTHRRFRA